MRTKEINEKFKQLDQQIKNLEKAQEDHYDSIQFLIATVSKYTDKPIFRIIEKEPSLWYGSCMNEKILQFVYRNRIREITTLKPIFQTELFAYCDTHFILKNSSGEYFLVNMGEKTIADIPAQLLFSKEKITTIEGHTLKICPTESIFGIGRVKND